MEDDPYQWQLARFRAAMSRLFQGNQLMRAQMLRSQEQIRISLELLQTPFPASTACQLPPLAASAE